MTTPGTEKEPAATQVPEASAKNAPASTSLGAFTGDAGVTTLRGAARAYVSKVRGGDPGALPAVLGLIVLLVIFSNMSKIFLTTGNLANVPAQAAPIILIAMGLVFVLLLGEIDLSAGTAAGVCATM